MALLGIDFGTYLSRAAVVEDGAVSAWVDILPAIAVSSDDGWRVGRVSRTAVGARPPVTLASLKRMLGRLPDDAVSQRVAARLGVTLHMPEGQLIVRTAAGQAIRVDRAVAELLARHVRSCGDSSDEHHAVLGVPGWFGASQEAALREAAANAGARVLRLMEDTAAVALWLAKDEPEERTVGIVNAGMGGTSVGVYAISHEGVYSQATASDREHGGDELVAGLVDTATKRLASDTPAARERVRQLITPLLPRLAAGHRLAETVPLVESGGPSGSIVLEPKDVEASLRGLLEPIADVCEEALDEAELEPDELDAVYAVGQLSAFPSVCEGITQTFHCQASPSPDFDTFVATSCAYEAAILCGAIKGPLVFDGKDTGSVKLPSR